MKLKTGFLPLAPPPAPSAAVSATLPVSNPELSTVTPAAAAAAATATGGDPALNQGTATSIQSNTLSSGHIEIFDVKRTISFRQIV